MDVANAFGISRTNSRFYYLTAASRDYGLTSGNSSSEKLELTALGRDAVYPLNANAEHQAKLKAFQTVDVFKKVLEYYKGNALPEMKYLGNILEREFGLASDSHEEFSALFTANCAYLGITSGNYVGGGAARNGSTGARLTEPSTIAVGEPKGEGTPPRLFVIMPFTERQTEHAKGFFDEVLRSLITPAGVEAGFHVDTANRQGSDLIHSTIINDLLEADLVLADLTEHNPNVLFELGLRMAHNKPIVLIKASGTGRIFDIDNLMRVYEYDSNLWKSTLAVDLPKIQQHIESAWRTRESESTYMNILRRGAPTQTDSAPGLTTRSPGKQLPVGLAGQA